MLVISRKVGERVQIGDDIFVDVARITGKQVRLAIQAPRNIRIKRENNKDKQDELSKLHPHDD